MLTFKEFDGINNVLPAKRLKTSELVRALNVDIGLTKDISRRAGYSEVVGTCHKNLWQAEGFMLATCDGDLTAIWPDTTRTVLYEGLGAKRVWYCNLPDGRTTFSNGLIQGITDGATVTGWGVPIPERIGTLLDTDGDLYPGDYQYQIAYVRELDGREGGPAYSNPFAVERGGIHLIGLPVLAGHRIAVYLTSHNGGGAYYAGSTTTDEFTFTGKNDELTLPARLDMLYPCPETASFSALYRGRVLVADGNVLYASRVGQPEVFDIRRDFKQFTAQITLIQPVNDGVYIGTENELAFLSGTEFDKLQLVRVMHGRVALGSGVTVPGEKIRLGDGVGRGQAVMCIVDGGIVAGFDGGNAIRLTENRYKTTATEVAATYRESNGIPQYLAIPQDVEAIVIPPVVFSPLDLFASSEQGAWYDPSDLSTMFQDSAGTTPVTATGQPVGKILDKSGRGNHASQATAAKRPILQNDGTNNYLAFDGVDDALATASINFTATDKMSVFSGVHKAGGAGFKCLIETGATGTGNNFAIHAPSGNGDDYGLYLEGGDGNFAYTAAVPAPVTNVLYANFDRTQASIPAQVSCRLDGAPKTLNYGALAAAGNFVNAAMYIGSRAGTSLPLNGRIYSMIVLGRLATTQEITDTEAWVNSKTGAY